MSRVYLATGEQMRFLQAVKDKVELAELVGILLGDGRITDMQVIVHGNLVTEVDYSRFVAGLFERLLLQWKLEGK